VSLISGKLSKVSDTWLKTHMVLVFEKEKKGVTAQSVCTVLLLQLWYEFPSSTRLFYMTLWGETTNCYKWEVINLLS